jgi:hypothetical protein
MGGGSPTAHCRCENTGGPFTNPDQPPVVDDEGCTITTYFFTYECRGGFQDPPLDMLDTFVGREKAKGNDVTVQPGTTANPCKDSEGCDGECPDTYVIVYSCGGPIPPDITIDIGDGHEEDIPDGNTPSDYTNVDSMGIVDNPNYGNVPSQTLLPTFGRDVEISTYGNVPTPPSITEVFGKEVTVGAFTDMNFPDIGDIDPSMEIFDREHTFLIPDDLDIVDRATNVISIGDTGDSNKILKDFIPIFVHDVLEAGLGGVGDFDGTTIGTFLYANTKLLGEDTLANLANITNANLSSMGLAQYLKKAIKRAITEGTLSDYSQAAFINMRTAATNIFPTGFPIPEQVQGSRHRAFGVARQTKQSLDNQTYVHKGSEQRFVQMYRIIATDINLGLQIRTSGGALTNASVGMDNHLGIRRADGTVERFPEVNDFINIRRQNGTVEKVGLKSDRNIAYNFDFPQMSVMNSLFKQDSQAQYGFSLSVSTINVQECEQASGSNIAEAYLFQLVPSSIADIPDGDPYTKKTKASYKLMWQSGADLSLFNDVVKDHSGPRNTVFVNVNDNWWQHLITRDIAQDGYFLEGLFTDLDIDGFDGNIYPRRVPCDLLIVPTDKVEYNILQGGSTLVTYPHTIAEQADDNFVITRTLNVMMNPLSEVYNQNYVETVKDANGLNVDGRSDIFSFQFKNSFTAGEMKAKTLKDPTKQYRAKSSVFGDLLNKVAEIKNSYSLDRGSKGEGIPQGDLFMQLTLPQYIKYIEDTPASTRMNFLRGLYNGVKVFAVKKTDTEKSFLTEARHIEGTDTIIAKKIPKVTGKYYPGRYKGKIGGIER